MDVLVVIPARGGSKGIPYKNIKLLNGKPLIYYSIDIARQFTTDNNICVTTDDERIIEVVESYGLKVPFKRPDYLATDTCGSSEVIQHAWKFYADKGTHYDAVLLLQPTSPFRKVDFLKDKPFFSEVAQEIIDFIKDCDILTYNGCNFDIPFLVNEFKKVGIEYTFKDTPCYDAFLEEKRRNGNMLEETYARYKGKTMEESGLQAHDAFSDVKATYSIFYAQQMKQHYEPENILTEDNVISMQKFQGQLVPCFNIGKYRQISLDFVMTIDKQYLAWCISDKCNFMDSTKEYIKNYIKEN